MKCYLRVSMTPVFLMLAVFMFTATHIQAQQVTIKIDGPAKVTHDDQTRQTPPFSGKRPAVDVAILLDTSNSMDGLINQAKTQLWKIVNQFAAAEKAGQTPRLRVSVFEYGNSSLPASEGYIRQVVPLTDDLDKVSEQLFALDTSGGDEYCGQVIGEALKRLDWSQQANSYKAIFIAGNEPFNQGGVDYRKSCKSAIEAGVVVNTIHCGDYQSGVSGQWQDGANIAEGKFLNINQDRAIAHIEAPQDKIIIELNTKLNQTYLWFGEKSKKTYYRKNQIEQDRNALNLGGRAGFGGGRAQTKASSIYNNIGRDLVDSYDADEQILKKVKQEELPEAMQKMSPEERLAHVKEMAKRRKEIQKEIAAAAKERAAYVAKERKKQASKSSGDTLGDVVQDTVGQQLIESGFKLKKQ